jgi:6-pyruvoyltetrahydropterin/6-carboxytetrahydropterin synthase
MIRMIRMIRLTRTVRCSINPPGSGAGAGVNGFAGKPAMRGLGRHYELDVACVGEPDPRTGYLIDIKDVDRAVHEGAAPVLQELCVRAPGTDPAAALAACLGPIAGRLRVPVERVTLRTSPYYAVSMSPAATSTVQIRQRFDFSAAHRLHAPGLSDEENRRTFGKCNNPEGHGHNYRVEPCVSAALGPMGPSLTLGQLEELTERLVIDRFDHKHLNRDTAEFGPGAGVNPSVEHIARVCFEILAPAVRSASPSAALESVTVWETDRTSATYRG